MPRWNLDKIGAYASTICAVHCLLTGVALGMLSVIGLGFLGSVTSEILFIVVAVSVGVFAVVHGIRKHRSYIPSLFFVFGLVCIVLKFAAFKHTHDPAHAGHTHGPASDGWISTALAVLGGLSLVAFHVMNLRMTRKCGCSQPHPSCEPHALEVDLPRDA